MLSVSPMLRVPSVSVVRFWVIVRAEVIFAVIFAVEPAPLATRLPDQAVVVLPQLPVLFKIQVPFCWAERFEIEANNKIAASASKTAIRIRRKDENGGLEFIGGGMNGGPIRKRKRASTPQKRQIPRHTKIPSPPAEREYKRRKRRTENGGMGSHTIVLHGGKGGLKKRYCL